MDTRAITPTPQVWTLAVPNGGAFQISSRHGCGLWMGTGEPDASAHGHQMEAGDLREFTIPATAKAYVRVGSGHGSRATVTITEGV